MFLRPVRTETYVGVVLTKINSDIECALVGFLKNRVKMHGDDNIEFYIVWKFVRPETTNHISMYLESF
jgi:hypothetical protein